MIWHLIAALFVAFGCAGIALYARFITRKRLPKWIVPAAAGLGILGYQIFHEYSWFERMQAKLEARVPGAVQVVELRHDSMFWRPWTYAYPFVSGFVVLDEASLQLAQKDGETIARFVLYDFEQAYVDHVSSTGYLLNCAQKVLVPLAENLQPQVGKQVKITSRQQLYQAVCN